MRHLKRFFSFLLVVSLLLVFSVTAFAATDDTGYADVAADAWYAKAVAYVTENKLMTGTGGARFSPETSTNLAMLVTILHNDAGTPAASTAAPAGATGWYAAAAAWAGERGLLADVNNSFTGTPITREDLVTVLWRYAGSPAASGGDFADEAEIASYASGAVDWARSNGVISGKNNNRFDPKGSTKRSELAAILQNFLTMESSDSRPEQPAGSKALVVYFSASNNTEAVAGYIADALNADRFEIVPAAPYTSDDLDWTNSGSRVNAEHDNTSLRNIELTASTVEHWDEYDTVFIGYPIWWGIAAWPTDSFVKANDFTGKTVIPFCTSASSGMGESGELLAKTAGTGNWLEGRRFRSGASESEVREWALSLSLPNM